MRARNRPEYRDKHPEAATSGDAVCEQRDSDVTARQPFTHDARAYYDGQQKRRANALGGELARECHAWPMSRTFFCSASRSSVVIGKLIRSSMRRFRMPATCTNLCRFSSSLP